MTSADLEQPDGGQGQLSAAARAAIDAGMPRTTRRAYRETLKRYVDWCDGRGFTALPSTGQLLTEYATWLAYDQHRAPGTIETVRWAILKWHELAAVPAPQTAGLVAVLKGYRAHLANTHDPKAEPRKATAASRDTLTAMIANLDTATLAGKRDKAIILTGFAIAGRRGEIASLDIGSFQFRPGLGVQVHVYREKTRKMDTPVIRYRPRADLCPVRAAEDLIAAMAACGRTEGPMFVRINRHGTPAHRMTRGGVPIGDPDGRMTGQAVAQVVHRAAVAAGLPGLWSGHSLRRGLATSMHDAGASRDKIEQQGGWTPGSRAVSGYIDEANAWAIDMLEGVL